MYKAIVGFKFKIMGMQAQFKLSQNKDEATKVSVITNLRQLKYRLIKSYGGLDTNGNGIVSVFAV